MQEQSDLRGILQDIQARLARLEEKIDRQNSDQLDIGAFAFNLRRARDKLFPAEYFSDHGWDILLELFQAQQSGRKIQTSALGLESSVPQTTMLRYLNLLCEDDLVYREPDPTDRRRIYTYLTRKGDQMMRSLFEQMRPHQHEAASAEEPLFFAANAEARAAQPPENPPIAVPATDREV